MIGDGIKRVREFRGLRQIDLAAKVRCTPAHLCYIESGRDKASDGLRDKLSTALDVPLWILEFLGDPGPDKSAAALVSGVIHTFYLGEKK